MDWIDKVLKDIRQMDNYSTRRYLDEIKKAVYDMCDEYVKDGASVQEAAVIAYSVIEHITPMFLSLWNYYIDMWEEERGL